MKTVSSTDAKARLNALLAEVESSGVSVTITNHGRPVAVLSPAHPRPRTFGQFPSIVLPADFDDDLPESEIRGWNGDEG